MNTQRRTHTHMNWDQQCELQESNSLSFNLTCSGVHSFHFKIEWEKKRTKRCSLSNAMHLFHSLHIAALFLFAFFILYSKSAKSNTKKNIIIPVMSKLRRLVGKLLLCFWIVGQRLFYLILFRFFFISGSIVVASTIVCITELEFHFTIEVNVGVFSFVLRIELWMHF